MGGRGESVLDDRIVDLDQAEDVVLLVSVGQPDVRLTRTSDERQKLSLSHFAFAIALLSG